MSLAPAVEREYGAALNEEQRSVVGHSAGPLLVIAGPGSGKTFSLVLRTLNLLLSGKAEPGEIVLCTFAEKAARELADRLSAGAAALGYGGDLSSLKVGTIHGLCNGILLDHRHRTPLGNAYETLDDLSQLLFLFEHLKEIAGEGSYEDPYLGRWKTRWSAVKGLRNHFDKITEELVDPKELFGSGKHFVRELGAAYLRYEEALFAENRVDFAHLQKLVHGLLLDEGTRDRIASPIRYVMVDEYQDTNYVQERVLGMLASGSGNLCVVGDEDQSLYRFRGATVRNILEFPERYPGAEEIKLTTNYRSHGKIVGAYDRWMASADWENRDGGRPFRYEKTVVPDPNTEHPDYPAVFSVWGQDSTDEASRFADMVAYLKAQGVVEDYSQVALLLHTVRMDHSGPYIEALKKKGIPAYCPRARSYFENEEVRLLVGAFAAIFGWHGEGRGDLKGGALNELAAYADRCLVELAGRFAPPHPLGEAVRRFAQEIESLGRADALDARPADYLYGLLAVDPFPALVGDENRARNLAIFSHLFAAVGVGFGPPADLYEARRPWVDGGEIVDDERHVGAAPSVAELLARDHVAAGVPADHDGLGLGVVKDPHGRDVRPAIEADRREASERLAVQVPYFGVGECAHRPSIAVAVVRLLFGRVPGSAVRAGLPNPVSGVFGSKPRSVDVRGSGTSRPREALSRPARRTALRGSPGSDGTPPAAVAALAGPRPTRIPRS